MDKIELRIIDKTNTGSYHVEFILNNDNCGILYLTQDEFRTLERILRMSDVDYNRTGDDEL